MMFQARVLFVVGVLAVIPSARPGARAQPQAARSFDTVVALAEEKMREMPVAFYGPDRVVITAGADRRQSIEFIRDAGGSVKWIRVVGRIAVREGS